MYSAASDSSRPSEIRMAGHRHFKWTVAHFFFWCLLVAPCRHDPCRVWLVSKNVCITVPPLLWWMRYPRVVLLKLGLGSVLLASRPLSRSRMPSIARFISGFIGYIAQWLERLTADQQVPGSNPVCPLSRAMQCRYDNANIASKSAWAYVRTQSIIPRRMLG